MRASQREKRWGGVGCVDRRWGEGGGGVGGWPRGGIDSNKECWVGEG